MVCLHSDAGADKDIAMQGGAAPLLVAFQQGRQEVVGRLSDARADKDIAMQDATPLLIASETGHLDVIRPRCEEQGGGITLICDREQTDHLLAPLLKCDEQGSDTTLHWVVCLLSDAGADRDIAMQGGATPLFIASQQGRQEVV